jgi:hypothetical protein
MSGHGVPSPYAGATRLDADANACLALARAKWHTLSTAQQRALVQSRAVVGGRYIRAHTNTNTARALEALGLVEATAPRRLTGLGVMVREAGIYTVGEANATWTPSQDS